MLSRSGRLLPFDGATVANNAHAAHGTQPANGAFTDYGTDISLLQTRAYALYVDKELEEDIDFCILSEEEMNDKASEQLFAIRKKIKAINADIKQKLQSYTKNSELSKYLQDSIVTLRGDRYVIPVKQEYKGFVNGIVHDQSATGATLLWNQWQ